MASLIQAARNVLSQRDPLLPNETKRFVLKEFLQAYTLDFLYNHPDYRRLNFIWQKLRGKSLYIGNNDGWQTNCLP